MTNKPLRANGAAAPTVYLVEDDPSIQRLVEQASSLAGCHVQCHNHSSDFLRLSTGYGHNGCIVLDIKKLDAEYQQFLALNLPLVILSDCPNVKLAVQAMKHGVVDYLLKPVDELELQNAIEQAVSRCISKDKSRTAIEATVARMKTLTSREREVMMLVVKGLPNKQIGDRLGIAEKTIKIHRGRMMKKMEVNSLAQLVHDVEHALML